MSMKRETAITFCLVICNQQVLGYIDPGTAGTVIGGSIWPFIVMIFAAIGGFFVKFFWLPIKNAFLKIKSVFKKQD